MRHGMGVLGWSPTEFWDATPIELYRAIEGWQEAHGIDPDETPEGPLTMDELYDLMERFPDA